MKRLFLIFGLVLCLVHPAFADNPDQMQMADHRILLLTSAGPLQLGLYPSSAPQTVDQIVSLVNQRLYDRVSIPRVEPDYLFQVGEVWMTDKPSAPQLWNKIPKLPLEAKGLKHTRGVLSLAHADGDPDSGQSSFSVLLADAPELDGQYTIFGQVIDSEATMKRIAGWPIDAKRVPKHPLQIIWARYLPAAEAARQARQLSGKAGAPVIAAAPDRFPVRILGSIALLAAGAFLFAARLGQKGLLALHMLILLLGLFGLIVLIHPKGIWMGGSAFLALVATFLLMSASESAPKK